MLYSLLYPIDTLLCLLRHLALLYHLDIVFSLLLCYPALLHVLVFYFVVILFYLLIILFFYLLHVLVVLLFLIILISFSLYSVDVLLFSSSLFISSSSQYPVVLYSFVILPFVSLSFCSLYLHVIRLYFMLSTSSFSLLYWYHALHFLVNIFLFVFISKSCFSLFLRYLVLLRPLVFLLFLSLYQSTLLYPLNIIIFLIHWFIFLISYSSLSFYIQFSLFLCYPAFAHPLVILPLLSSYLLFSFSSYPHCPALFMFSWYPAFLSFPLSILIFFIVLISCFLLFLWYLYLLIVLLLFDLCFLAARYSDLYHVTIVAKLLEKVLLQRMKSDPNTKKTHHSNAQFYPLLDPLIERRWPVESHWRRPHHVCL